MNIKENDLFNRTVAVQQWVESSHHDKHVQFSQNLTSINKNNQTKQVSSSIYNKYNQNSVSIDGNNQSGNISNDLSNIVYYDKHQPLTTDSRFYRTSYNDNLSQTTRLSSSPSLIHSRQSSFSSNHHLEHEPQTERERTSSIVSSIESSPSYILSSVNKDHLSSLELNESLSEIDRKKFDDIRQLVSDEFENLVPTLIKLGVILIPKKFFEINTENMSGKDLTERHRLILLIKKDQENIKYKEYIENLYLSQSYDDNIINKRKTLRETLSYKGQLALLSTYQDEIECELNKKIPQWKLISFENNRTNLSEYSYSTNQSSFISNSFQLRKKSHRNSSVSIKSNKDLLLTNNQNYFLTLSLPQVIDNQWLNKTIVHSIEQAMILLDRIRSLSSNNLTNISSNHLFIQQNIFNKEQIDFVKAFKQWSLLISILYT
ncbi:unnamed protein product [Rotaria sordida]|uniref:Uncharacterized protein n=1 Tax=Rotaria sordida TaxID=392033 RepID=A0A814J355_9BILA|nr:unnamed protein product [Rotaria sordida]CAF4027606.1 unnamed protein product [Rotaria sordida]